TATHPQGTPASPARPSAFDTVVTDCVPAHLEVDPTSFEPSSAAATVVADDCADGGTRITWSIGELAAGDIATLDYDVVVTPLAAGGAEYVNTATLTAHTLAGSPTGRGATMTRTDD